MMDLRNQISILGPWVSSLYTYVPRAARRRWWTSPVLPPPRASRYSGNYRFPCAREKPYECDRDCWSDFWLGVARAATAAPFAKRPGTKKGRGSGIPAQRTAPRLVEPFHHPGGEDRQDRNPCRHRRHAPRGRHHRRTEGRPRLRRSHLATHLAGTVGQVQQAGQQMHDTASKLESILGGAKNRGTFGETTLERLLEDSLPRSQYTLQYNFRSGKSADAVIHLRDKKIMAIDSKFPLDAFQRLEVEDEAGRKEARRDFINAVKNHASSIAEKYIVPDEGTLELALMFVPSEAVYYELLRSTDSKEIAADAYCRSKKIVPVSPNTLYAHLSVIAMGLRGMQIEENAKRLSANLDGLRKHLENFSEPFDKIGTHLKNAQQCYAEADKRFEKASNTLENLLNSGEVHQLELEDEQGSLTLPASKAA